MNTIDHAEQAIGLLESIQLSTDDVYSQTEKHREIRLALATVHAQLAVARQMQIANMQEERARLWVKSGRVIGSAAQEASEQAEALDTQIRDGLGLL